MRMNDFRLIVSVVLIFACAMEDVFAVTFTVTKTTDTYPIGQIGELRWAIQSNNRTSGINRIEFNISGDGPFIIQPKRDLDYVTNPVVIDGYSQPGASVNTLSAGNNAVLKIVLNGNNYQQGNAALGTGNGLVFTSGAAGSTIRGLVINEWINTGIFLYHSDDISILGNFIGTDSFGLTQQANQAGVFAGSSNNLKIGTSEVADRNVIGGNFFYFNESACIAMVRCRDASIKNNYIGVDSTGSKVLGNSLVGIESLGCVGITIGGLTALERNVISGHTIAAVLFGSVKDSVVKNNYIGSDVAGSLSLGNGNAGISLYGSGTENSCSGNEMSDNLIVGSNVGIKLGHAASRGVNKNRVVSNFIGVDVTGSVALPNNYGIIVNDDFNTIGTITLSTGNIISGNSLGGIWVYGPARGNTIQGNFIGLTAAGHASLLNGYGIRFDRSFNEPGNDLEMDNIFGEGNTALTLLV